MRCQRLFGFRVVPDTCQMGRAQRACSAQSRPSVSARSRRSRSDSGSSFGTVRTATYRRLSDAGDGLAPLGLPGTARIAWQPPSCDSWLRPGADRPGCSVGDLGWPDHAKPLETQLDLVGELDAQPRAGPVEVAAVPVKPALQRAVVLALVPGELLARSGDRQTVNVTSEELVESLWSELWSNLSDATPTVRASVAKQVAPQIRATRKFVDFLVECAPEPPALRPSWVALDWDAMADHATLIYRHRSAALHAGKPFPMPMLDLPRHEEHGAIRKCHSASTAADLAASGMPRKFRCCSRRSSTSHEGRC